MRASLSLLLWGTALTSFSTIAAAQTTAPAVEPAPEAESGIQDIVVTSQRRPERLQSVPVAVSAFTPETLANRQVQSTEGLIRLVPNMQGSNGTGLGTGNNYSLRGLFNTESLATFDSPVATYVDGIYQGRIGSSNFALFDLDRIEVLRGPQGTLFGKNTTGGAISLVLKPAKLDENEGMVEAGYGSYDRVRVRASANAALSPILAARVSAFFVDDGGYVDNVTTGKKINDEHSWGLRGTVRLQPSSDFRWDLSGTYSDLQKAYVSAPIVNGERVSMSGLRPLGALVPSSKGQLPGNSNRAKNLLVTSDINIETGIGSLQWLVGYTDLKQAYLLDFFNSPFVTGGFTYANESRTKQISSELKLSGAVAGDSLRYVAGLFYLDESNRTDFADILNTTGTPRVTADRLLRNRTESFAVYAQLDYTLLPDLTVTAGARTTYERKLLALSANPNPNVAAAAQIGDAQLIAAGIPLRLTTTKVTPRFAIGYKPTRNVMLFASATNGFKSGGWNGRATTAPTFLAFSPETVWSYEGGIKSDWFNRRLRVNLTAFNQDVHDLQIPTNFTASNGAITFLTRNFANLRTRGIELELTAQPLPGVTVGMNGGLLESRFTRLNPAIAAQQVSCRAQLAAGVTASNCGQGIVRADGSIAGPARSPGHTATVFADYRIALGNDYAITPSASATFYGRYNVSTSGLAVAEVPAYTLVNAGITLAAPNGWQLSVECSNCTDKTYLNSALSNRLYYAEPRRIDARIKAMF